jgi:DNA-binding transcriptional ArsR family regulator
MVDATPGATTGARQNKRHYGAYFDTRPCSRRAVAFRCQVGYIPAVASTWSVLADPRRREVLELLRAHPRTVNELTAALGLTQPGTSKHLRVLRDAGLVRVRADAQRRFYELDPGPLAELDGWLAPYRRFWDHHLDALGRHLDAATDPTPDRKD